MMTSSTMQHEQDGREPTEPTDAELLNNVRRMFRCAIFLAEADERWGGTAKRTPADRSAWEDRERWLLRLVDRVKTVTPELDANISDRLRIDPADLSGARPMPATRPAHTETVCTYPDCRCPVDALEGFCLKGLPIPAPDGVAPELGAECEHGHLARKCETCALIEREAECVSLTALVEELQKDRDRLFQDRYDLLSVTSTDGLLSSEWVMRSATAERKAKDLEAANTALTARVSELEAVLRQVCDEDEYRCRCEDIGFVAKMGGEKCGLCKATVLLSATGKEPTDAE